jgi:hypothetical protein
MRLSTDAGEGGAVAMNEGTTATFNGLTVKDVSAPVGAAIAVRTRAQLTCTACAFQDATGRHMLYNCVVALMTAC